MDKDCGFERLLGMVWLPEEDMFTFRLSFREDHDLLLSGEEIPTKQQLLSVVMSIYDPTGFLAAFIIHGKIIIQDVWRSGVDWKNKIPDELVQRWKQWIALLPKIEDLKIPRCYFPGYHPDSLRSLELHVFVNASELAYSAVAHFRLVDRGSVRCAFVASKTKVAPLDPLSIPRLEANAGVLGVRLRKSIVTGHSLPITRTRFWTDSKTVLQWIRSKDLRRYRPYVAFRMNEILSMSAVAEWGYCPSRLNVADLATKWGKQGPPLDINSPFYQSQEFVYDNPSEWPEPCEDMVELAPEELRPSFVFAHFVLKPTVKWERFSKWERLLRTMAYVQRFIARKLNREKKPWQVDLTREELQKAEQSLWRLAQSEEYRDEVATLNQNQRVPADQRESLERSSNIVKLCPMLDDAGVLRVSGRIQAAECVGYETKHPVILPRDHPVTTLLLEYYHRRFQHSNNETVVNEIRQNLSIPKLRVLVRLVSNNCKWCEVYKSTPVVPQMAPLPRARLSPFLRPFTFTGVDYFGPYLIKTGRSITKRWVALFTCLTIRAVHLEIVANLSTESFKKAVRRFIARRGAPQEIYSDRGTNFQGASSELTKEISLSINKELASTFTDAHTQWRFNPPAAPHMGGSWERMVRSVKAALGAIPLERKLDEESMVTMLTEAEHMVNSRPLTFIPLEGADQESLTPNHFLLMSSSGVQQPVKDPMCEGAALRNSWNQIQHALDEFWRRWVREYLPTLSRRSKWFEETRPLREGDLVVVVDEGTRNRWQRGRVLRTYPGKDGRVRRVDVQTAKGILPSRAVARLALLDVGNVGDAEGTLPATRGGEC
ncbi:uncharacterized protein LOC120414198 [Culex pipiens pallens]|uniref:uncharacterized protein LOC120414198 n=1 Tax=Culex pipiens pallens TaxID=42434 RepID=UPI001954DD4E|nr:uncharacterized protein LOC120414198 [Culex pipiens pallens]